MYFKGSRYAKVPTLTLSDAAGRRIVYTTTRFIPRTEGIEGHRVVDGERLDHISWQHYRDAERYWRICDANSATWPDDLLEPAVILNVPPVEN
jgi:hypothetical protein